MRTTAPLTIELRQAIAAAQTRASAEKGFAARVAALELLEVHVFDRLRCLAQRDGLLPEVRALEAEAEALARRLEAANARLIRALRRQIQAGHSTPTSLRRALVRHGGPPGAPGGYDALDLLVAGMLDAGPLGEEQVTREPEMVFYQPTPARVLLSLVDRARIRPGDVVYDLGSGLGRVVILVSLLSGARAVGVEREPAYCEYAERCARTLQVPRVEFLLADAREAPLSDGTVFFLYTPFRGALLEQVLERLRRIARERPIRVCTLGPCTVEVAACGWLKPADDGALADDQVAVFLSR